MRCLHGQSQERQEELVGLTSQSSKGSRVVKSFTNGTVQIAAVHALYSDPNSEPGHSGPRS